MPEWDAVSIRTSMHYGMEIQTGVSEVRDTRRHHCSVYRYSVVESIVITVNSKWSHQSNNNEANAFIATPADDNYKCDSFVTALEPKWQRILPSPPG